MVDYFEALRVQATPNPLPPPVDPQQVEADRQLAEVQHANEAAIAEQNLKIITAAKIGDYRKWLNDYHLFPGTNPAEIFSETELKILANFLPVMHSAGLPGAVALSSEEKRLQDVERKRFGRTRTITVDETRSLPVTLGYLLGVRLAGASVELGGSRLEDAELGTVQYREQKGESGSYSSFDSTKIKKVYLCADGMLREVDDNVIINREAYFLGQWAVTKAVLEVPKGTMSLNRQVRNHNRVSVIKGSYTNPLIFGDGQICGKEHRRMRNSGEQDGYHYESPTFEITHTDYLPFEDGGLHTRLLRIIKGLSPESIKIPAERPTSHE